MTAPSFLYTDDDLDDVLYATSTNRKPVTNSAIQITADKLNKIRTALGEVRDHIGYQPISAATYGAVGDGVTDDAPAINAAIAVAAEARNNGYGAFVAMGKGTYLLGAPLVLYNGVGLLSTVPTAATLKASNTFNSASLIRNISQDGTQEFAFLYGLIIDGNVDGGAVCSTALVDLGSLFVNSYVRDCIILNSSSVGLRVAATSTPGGMGPIAIENVWVAHSAGDNIVGEETAGNTGACAGIKFSHITSENQGSNKAAIRLTGLGHATQWNLDNIHIEMGNANTGRVGIKLDGVSHCLIDGVQLLTSAGTVSAGIQITNVVSNVGIQIRAVTNENLINPVLSDLKNNVSYGAINVPIYVTSDVGVRGGMRFIPGSASGSKSVAFQSSALVDRAWFDDLGQLTGSSLNGAGLDVVSSEGATNDRALTLVNFARDRVYGWNFPVSGGGVLRFRYLTGGVDVFQVGTDGTVFHYEAPTFQKLATFQSAIKGAGARAAAPSTGTHVAGEVVLNADPIAGGFIGWVCVTGGSPGTWKSWGAISP